MLTARAIAQSRFRLVPGKAFQRHVREIHAEREPRTQIESLDGAEVVAISKMEASKIILNYEYLATLGRGAAAFYGLRVDGELLGAVVFGVGSSHGARNICGHKHVSKTICLMRGACVPWAPKNAASFLIRHACRKAHRQHGWQIFFAYSDPSAGEVGTVYQAVGWKYIGRGVGGHSVGHLDWITPDGRRITSHNRKYRREHVMYAAGCWPVAAVTKHRYVWFESPELVARCRFAALPYPKRRFHA